MAQATLKPAEALRLFAVLAMGGEAAQGEVKPSFKKEHREALERAGLLSSEKRARNAVYLTVTDAGWDWAGQNLDHDLGSSNISPVLLRRVLTMLKGYLARSGVSLAEVLVTPVAQPEPADLPARIREASLRLAEPGGRVRLHELRQHLSDVERDKMDAALIELARQDRIALYPIDDPRDIQPGDKQAALQAFGATSHILYLRK